PSSRGGEGEDDPRRGGVPRGAASARRRREVAGDAGLLRDGGRLEARAMADCHEKQIQMRRAGAGTVRKVEGSRRELPGEEPGRGRQDEADQGRGGRRRRAASLRGRGRGRVAAGGTARHRRRGDHHAVGPQVHPERKVHRQLLGPGRPARRRRGGGEGSDSSDDDGLDLYPEGVERPSKRRKLRDDNDGYDDSSDDSDRSYRPSGVKKQRADDGGDDDEDGAGTSRKVPYSVRVKRARRGSTKYGTASNNYNTSQFDEDTPRGEMLTRLLEKYTEEKRNAPTVRRSRLLGFVEEIRAEDPGRYGPVETDPVKLKKKLSREYRRRNPGAAPHASRALVDEMYRRYSAVRRDLPPGAKVPRGCTAAIVEAVKAENPGVNLGAKDGSIKVVLHMRYAKEFPESKGLTGQKLTSTWDPEAKRRRERLYNEITLRYKRGRQPQEDPGGHARPDHTRDHGRPGHTRVRGRPRLDPGPPQAQVPPRPEARRGRQVPRARRAARRDAERLAREGDVSHEGGRAEPRQHAAAGE
ncbi:hypothetical protein THAOC_36728, partial [Thalassiosira oceanica]